MQAGQQAQPQQQQQDNVAPQAQAPTAQQQGQQVVHLNSTYNYWMNVHHFIEGVKVQRFCLTLLGE